MAFAELVRTMGVEPIPPFGERILSPLRLPFRHVRLSQLTQQSRASITPNLGIFMLQAACNKSQAFPTVPHGLRRVRATRLRHVVDSGGEYGMGVEAALCPGRRSP
jgi:hypothetical protein